MEDPVLTFLIPSSCSASAFEQGIASPGAPAGMNLFQRFNDLYEIHGNQ